MLRVNIVNSQWHYLQSLLFLEVIFWTILSRPELYYSWDMQVSEHLTRLFQSFDVFQSQMIRNHWTWWVKFYCNGRFMSKNILVFLMTKSLPKRLLNLLLCALYFAVSKYRKYIALQKAIENLKVTRCMAQLLHGHNWPLKVQFHSGS